MITEVTVGTIVETGDEITVKKISTRGRPIHYEIWYAGHIVDSYEDLITVQVHLRLHFNIRNPEALMTL